MIGRQHFIQHTVNHFHLLMLFVQVTTDNLLRNIYRQYSDLVANITNSFFLLLLNLLFYIIQFLLRNGFRMVVFSVIIMIVVLFFRKGIMGERELPDLFGKRAKKAKKNVVEEGKADA